MNDNAKNKQTIGDLIQVVWVDHNIAALPEFWTEDCVNHAMPGAGNRGLGVLRAYHEAFIADFAAFSDIQIEVLNQVAEGEQVVTHMATQGRHSGVFFGIPPSGRTVSLSSIRIDRFEGGKIAEHWSVADMMGQMQQLQA